MSMNASMPAELGKNRIDEDKDFEEMSAFVENTTPQQYVSKRRGTKTKEKESLMM